MFHMYGDIVTVDEVCKMLRLSRSTVYAMLRSNELAAKRRHPNGKYIIRKSNVIRYAKSRDIEVS